MGGPPRTGILIAHICRCVLLALALIGLTRGAAAHAVLLDSVPADGASLAQSPGEVCLIFSEPVAPIAVRLLDEAGRNVAGATVEAVDRTVILRPPGVLSTGTYVVSYRVTSQDSHAVAGSILFAVGEAAVRPEQAEVGATDRWRIAVAANRMLWIATSLTAAGIAMFLLLCGPLLPPAHIARLSRRLNVAAAMALPLGVLAVGLVGGLLLDARAAALFDPATWRLGGTTTVGRSMAVGVAGLATLGSSTLLRSAPLKASMRAIGLALIVASFGLTGHAATVGPAIAMGSTVALHAGLAAFWWGGLIGLGVVLDGMAPAMTAPVMRRFSQAAMYLVALLVALGVAIALVQLRHPAALIATGYGLVLCGKLLTVAGLLSVAAYNRLRLAPRLAGGDRPALRSLRRMVQVEVCLVSAVFILTAVLGQLPPPRSMSGNTAASAVTAEIASSNGTARIEIAPGRTGPNELFLQLADDAGRPLTALEVTLAASLPAAGIEPIRRSPHEVAAGRYHLPELALPVPGRWTLRIEALVSDFDKRRFTLEVEIK